MSYVSDDLYHFFHVRTFIFKKKFSNFLRLKSLFLYDIIHTSLPAKDNSFVVGFPVIFCFKGNNSVYQCLKTNTVYIKGDQNVDRGRPVDCKASGSRSLS